MLGQPLQRLDELRRRRVDRRRHRSCQLHEELVRSPRRLRPGQGSEGLVDHCYLDFCRQPARSGESLDGADNYSPRVEPESLDTLGPLPAQVDALPRLLLGRAGVEHRLSFEAPRLPWCRVPVEGGPESVELALDPRLDLAGPLR
jgi:hypothetical protein